MRARLLGIALLALWTLGLRVASSADQAALIVLAIPWLVLVLADVRPRWLEHALALATPLGLFLTLNLRALDAWWIHDDPCLLASAFRGGIAAHFFDPEVWRGLSGSVLMPWTILSLGTDARLFGLEPAAFYVHQLLAFGLLLGVAYALLRCTASWPAKAASLALSLFAVAVPSFAVAQRLMNRHYLEGLILFLVALILYLRSVRTGRLGPAIAGAGLYLLATTAKEVFVPLVAVLPLLPVGAWRNRVRSTAPFGVAAALYLPWRLYMLGWANSLSGYAPKSDLTEIPGLLSLSGIVGLVRPWQLLVATFVVGVALGAAGRRSRSVIGLAMVTAAVTVVPLLPVLGELAPRHFLLPAFAVGSLIAWTLAPWRSGVVAGLGLALLLFALHAHQASPIRRGLDDVVERHRVEGAFVLESEDEGMLLTRIGDPNYLKCMAELRRDVLGKARGPGFCGDPCWCAGELASGPFWRVEGGGIAAADPRACAQEERDLRVEMTYDSTNGRLRWRLEPYRGGRGAYAILLLSGAEPRNVSAPVPIALSGEIPFPVSEPLELVVRYHSSDGWRTYSPILTLDPVAGSLRWERSGLGESRRTMGRNAVSTTGR